MTSVVLDNGSDSIKIGLSDKEEPKSVFPSLIGVAKKGGATFVGSDAQPGRDLDFRQAIVHGAVADWDAMTKILEHAYGKVLSVDSKAHRVLATNAEKNPAANKEKMAQILFETFQVPALHVASPPVLALYAYGHTTGVVFDSGHGVTQIVPIYEGFSLPKSALRFDHGGDEVTKYLHSLLAPQLASQPDALRQARKIKEEHCYVTLDYDTALQESTFQASAEQFKLPDGRLVSLGNTVFRAAEVVFDPSLVGSSVPGAHQAIYDCVMKCAVDVRKDLFANVLLVGGNTLFQGLPKRLQHEMETLAPSSSKVRVIAEDGRLLSVWQGGAVLASLGTFKQLAVSREEYSERGPAAVHRNSF